jgi:hypothetical protein
MTEPTNTIDTTGTAGTADATEAEIAEIRAGRLDDAHLAWFIAESECERALRAWRTGDDGDIAYCSYLAALNREESAAQHLERVWQASEPRALTLVQRMQDAIH